MKKNRTLSLALTVLLTTSYSFSQWTNVNCPGSATTYDITVSGAKLFVARGNSGVFSTTDGTSWDTLDMGTTGSFRSMKNFNDTLYSSTNGSSLFYSTDNGNNWTSLPGRSGLISVYATSIFKNNSVLIYGTNSSTASLYYSVNNGSNWSTSQFDLGSGAGQGFEAAQYDIVELNGTLYFASLKDLFKSIDNGATWTVVSGAPEIPDGTVTSLCTIDGGLLLTIYGRGVHRSIDGGDNWTKVLGGSLGTLTNNMTRVYYENNLAIAGGAAGQVYMSNDNGVNWTDISETGITTGEVIQSIKIFNGYVYVGTNLNVYSREIDEVGTSLQEFTKFTLYPNPVNNVLHIDLSSVESADIQLYDVNGKQLFAEKYYGLSILDLDVSSYPCGVYFLRVNNKTEKVIKQ